MDRCREVWVTGIGLVSSLGEGAEAHLRALSSGGAAGPCIDTVRFAPYAVHPLAEGVDLNRFIPAKADQKQMGTWQRLGVHAAGLALEDAGVLGNGALLDGMDLVVAAGNGERDEALDTRILATITNLPSEAIGPALNAMLMTGRRPTLYLGELSNLLAGNIQIVLQVTGSSRTLKGEEIAGLSAVEDATRRIATGDTKIALVGGALNAERSDLLLSFELGGNLWPHRFATVWQRSKRGDGMVLGSAAAFLVLEDRAHAEARGAKAYAKVSGIASNRSRRDASGDIDATLSELFQRLSPSLPIGPLALLSGASGAEPATAEELCFLHRISSVRAGTAIRAYGTTIGHAVEAHFPLGLALACLSLRHQDFYPRATDADVEHPLGGSTDVVLVTSVGHWRGEGLAVVERVGREAVSS